MTRYADLAPADRRAIRSGKAARPEPRAPRADPIGRDTATYRCRTCGAELVGYLRCERHVHAEHGGGVVQVVWHAEGAKLPTTPPPPDPEDPEMPPTLTAVPTSRDEAERAILAELGDVQDKLRETEGVRDQLLARRRELYNRGRGLRPPVPGAAMARACRISDAALVLSARRAPKG